ncbi:DEAD/DEAH box helicase [Parashewanella spongiae]|uniref:DEAD/DEAH box helicase n=1 Tax=Parashewanella spongiae TaxID=342950 RepID=A0A3A6TES6_9GAMM|nr:DEAD/DEAH box helicase [Parashewanella spongiae]MCL1079265.1 DEAD/DEAH box helicase [Parashewanella spongiae]RJY05350.1 DEAD/DEAH box helicase [Parashewanella spongiae]
MKLIHLFWQANLDDFDNSGALYLWIESRHITRQNGYYPYQLDSALLSELCSDLLSTASKPKIKSVLMPCNKQSNAIPSPIIANLCDVIDLDYHQHGKQKLNIIELSQPIEFLKQLNFKSFHFDDDLNLADDAKFWIKFAYELIDTIKQDLYVPRLIKPELLPHQQHQYSNQPFYTKWQWVDEAFNNRIHHIAACMPFSACLGDFNQFDAISALNHFSDVCLNQFIKQTSFTQKALKGVTDTFVQSTIEDESIYLNDEQYHHWYTWFSRLQSEQQGSEFTICFKLIEASDGLGDNWGLDIQLQSKRDPSFMVSLCEFWKQKDNEHKLYTKLLGQHIERFLLLQLGYASRIYPIIERFFEAKMQLPFAALTHDQAFQFLKEDAWSLSACGYRIIVPAWWTTKGRLKAKAKLKAKKNNSSTSKADGGFLSQDNLIQFDFNYAMGEHELDANEWQQLLEAKSELVYFRGNWVEINKDEMLKMQKLIETANKDRKQGNVADLISLSADSDSYDVELDTQVQQMFDQLLNKDAFKSVAQPKNLKATLRPYQNRGLSWLAYLESLGMNPCLADDMGLGKTMQVISLLLRSPQKQPAILIAPTSVVGNWFKELQKFAPEIKALIHHGSNRKNIAFADQVAQYQVVITSYGLLRKDKTILKDIDWSRIIIDEAQNIKNPMAQQTKALLSLSAPSRLALTGTPIENRLMDLWSIFNFLNPGLLGSQASFRKQFETPIQRDNNLVQNKLLKRIVEPFILRRLKTDKNIIQDLPDKIEQKVYCQLSGEQASLYQTLVDEITEQIEEAESDNAKQKAVMLSALLKLKQCCNHPAQLLQDGSDFSVERSIKLQRLVELCTEAMNNQESILIFSQFTDICGQLELLLKKQHGFNTYYLHGGTSRTKREKMVDEFQQTETAPSIFILSLKAGGVGITLTKANHVIHFDRWWNPAVENQATDRAFRIGQNKTVFAHKFISIGTIEEKIDDMLESKQKIADSIVGADESWLSKLDAKAFVKLIQLSRENT